MALENTRVVCTLDYTHAAYAALTGPAKAAAVFCCGKGGAAFIGHNRRQRRQQRGMGALGGLVGDSKSFLIGRNGAWLSLPDLWLTHERTRRDLAEGIAKGAVQARVINAGTGLAALSGIEAATDDGWGRTGGFLLTANEVEQQYIEPRKLYEDITSDVPSTNYDGVEKFLHLRRKQGAKIVVDVNRTVGAGAITLALYAWNPVTEAPMLVETIANAENKRHSFDVPYAWVHPVVTGVTGGNTVSVDVGVSIVN